MPLHSVFASRNIYDTFYARGKIHKFALLGRFSLNIPGESSKITISHFDWWWDECQGIGVHNYNKNHKYMIVWMLSPKKWFQEVSKSFRTGTIVMILFVKVCSFIHIIQHTLRWYKKIIFSLHGNFVSFPHHNQIVQIKWRNISHYFVLFLLHSKNSSFAYRIE